jgi:hypothetical protein
MALLRHSELSKRRPLSTWKPPSPARCELLAIRRMNQAPPVHGHDRARVSLCRFEQSDDAIPRMLNLNHWEVLIMTPGLVWLVAAIALGVVAGLWL